MKAAKIATALGFTKDAYPILVEESATQTKAIAAMIETAKQPRIYRHAFEFIIPNICV